MNETVEVLIPKEEIESKLIELAEQISRDYAGKEIVLICVLMGGMVFMSDLARRIAGVSVRFDMLAASSYGNSTESSGSIRLYVEPTGELAGKDLIVVEDIVDTGRTLSYIVEYLKAKNPSSVKICALLDKPSRREAGLVLNADYLGFTIPDYFVVGYGIDYAQKYRNLAYVGMLRA
jgi:hypoxanthine phosphoribosyltransferase